MNRCGYAAGCGLEIAMEDGTWERVGTRVFRSDAMTRPAEHDWEYIPPHLPARFKRDPFGTCRTHRVGPSFAAGFCIDVGTSLR